MKTQNSLLKQSPYEKGHEDPLFGAIAQLAANAMQQGCTIQAALAVVSQAFRFADQIIEDFETKEPLAEPVACKARCHYCCCYEVVLTPVEALLLGNRVKETFSESALADLMKKIDRILSLETEKTLRKGQRSCTIPRASFLKAANALSMMRGPLFAGPCIL